ncbi:glycosyltransferase [Streptomyces sp. B1866]|uniref:nucleotide disphospho-sugar-binding domain-containing protein n=1 Tax=Streptomyces sp. B1866 TaxID=3075431 RepID=UPI0028920EB5|nr:nucleotide disphospho-sugar-binding domain-containing protein [Streptomyces sp. B1866]MDT3400562.1 glycosyltransferase [Streptomyces sp. B1866]
MRVLFTTRAAGGHLWPMVPLARSFLAAGHRLRFAVPPGCAATVARTGLVPVPVGVAPARAGVPTAPPPVAGSGGQWPADWPVRPAGLSPEQHRIVRALARQRVRAAEAMAPDLIAWARLWQPDLVVHDASTYAGTVAAAALGVPAVSHLWGSAAVVRFDREGLDPAGQPQPAYARLLDRYGVPPDREPDVWLDPCPPSLALPSAVRRMPVRYVPSGDGPAPPGEGGGPDDPARQRVCLAWESPVPPAAVTDALLQAATRGVRAVRAGGAAGPLPALLPGCRVLVHQGGGAVVMTGVVAGVPQLVLPYGPEQQLNAARLRRTGAARRGAARSAGHLAKELFALLEQPGYAVAARALRDEALALPGPDETVARLTDRRRPVGWGSPAG